MRKYTNLELAQLFDKKDWETLWKIMTPMIRHAVRRCMQEGLDPAYVREDMLQIANLAAWESLPRWNAFQGSLQTWVREKVRSAILDANRREQTGMIGGRDSGPMVVSMHGETAEDDGGDDEQELPQGPEASMVYEDAPLGFEDPAIEQWLLAIPPEDRDMVRRLAGLGVPRETQAEYAAAVGVTERTVRSRVRALRNLFPKNP